MSTGSSNRPISIMEYYDWVASQQFKDSKEHHQYVSQQEQDFLQYLIYPMFYRDNKEWQFGSPLPFPLVLKTYSTKKPKYVIDNEYFTCVFFSYENAEAEVCWEVSLHIKDHDFCDISIKDFKEWYKDHYWDFFPVFNDLKGMPKRFLYPDLDVNSKTVDDFCVEFWGFSRDFMFFKLLDLLRIY